MNAKNWLLLGVVLWWCATVCCSSALAGNLPLPRGEARTPETRTLTAQEAAQALENDWLFQAMGEPLLDRSAKEIGWARQLAERLSRHAQAPDLSAELKELNGLEKRLGSSRRKEAQTPLENGRPRGSLTLLTSAATGVETIPSWIWYPEGKPAEDAPAAARCFRSRFEVPAGVRAAHLRIAADDACEIFLNGNRLGTHETWQRTAVFPVGRLLKTGTNVLAVRAENRPAPSRNPAGLIARLVVTLADDSQVAVVSDGSWRAANEARPQWEQIAFDDSAWKPATVAATFGAGPWGIIAGLLGDDVQDDPVVAYAHTDRNVREFYFAVRRVKHRIALKNPASVTTASRTSCPRC